MREYIEKRRGERNIWIHRMKSSSYVPGTIRFEVLKRAKGKCQLCGIPTNQKFLQVDRITSRNKVGKFLELGVTFKKISLSMQFFLWINSNLFSSFR